MIPPRIGLLSLCVVGFGLMTAMTSAAQASPWLILNSKKEAKEAKVLPASVVGELESGTKAQLSTKILGVTFTISCTSIQFIGMKLEGEGALTNGSRAKFTGCVSTLNGEPSPECDPHSQGAPSGTIETAEFKGHKTGVGSVVVEPTNERFLTLEFGPACFFSTKFVVRGTLTVTDKSLATHSAKHFFVASSSGLTTSPGEGATAEGKGWVFLSGEHTGLLWGG